MRLTVEEFSALRPIQWTSRVSLDKRIYYTAVNATYTRLFNLDVLRKIIAPKFASQTAIVRLNNYNIDRPIVLRSDLELELPDDVETVVYFANAAASLSAATGIADTKPFYNSKFTMQTVIVATAVLFAIIAFLSILVQIISSGGVGASKIIKSTRGGDVDSEISDGSAAVGWRWTTLVRDRVL